MTLLELEKIWEIVRSGGPVMVPLLVLGVVLYAQVVGLLRFVLGLQPADLLRRQCGGAAPERAAVIDFRRKLGRLVETRLRFAGVLIAAAPLLGLLGTVMGMLETFRGLGAEAGEDTARAVADGVKVALITTQTGLMIALAGLFLTQWIAREQRRNGLRLLELELPAEKTGGAP